VVVAAPPPKGVLLQPAGHLCYVRVPEANGSWCGGRTLTARHSQTWHGAGIASPESLYAHSLFLIMYASGNRGAPVAVRSVPRDTAAKLIRWTIEANLVPPEKPEE